MCAGSKSENKPGCFVGLLALISHGQCLAIISGLIDQWPGPGLIGQFLLRSCGSGLFGQSLVGPRHEFKGQLTDGSTSAQPLPTVRPSLRSGGAHLSTLAQRSGRSTHLCGTMLETYRMVQNGLMFQILQAL